MSSRTIQQAPQRFINNRWGCVFQTYIHTNGKHHLASEVKTPPIWETQEAAYGAGHRALVIQANTGKFPNMCEIW